MLLLTAAVGALGLIAGSRPWLALRVVRESPLPPVEDTVAGADVAPLVPGLALVVLAGAAGLLATRRRGRVAIAVAILTAGAGMVAAALPWSGTVASERAQDAALDVALPSGALEVSGGVGPFLAVLAGGLAVLLGIAIALRCRRWPVMGTRYDAPPGDEPAAVTGAVADSASPTDREAWEALDRGEDPTRGPPR